MAANAIVVHQIPGRVRLRIPEKRGDHDYFSRLSEKLSGSDTVHGVKTNASTASVVVEYFDSLDELIELMRGHDVEIAIEPRPAEQHPASEPARMMSPINIVSGREINPMFMLGTMFAVIGIVQAIRGKILLPSLSAFWYAIAAFRQSGNGEDDIAS